MYYTDEQIAAAWTLAGMANRWEEEEEEREREEEKRRYCDDDEDIKESSNEHTDTENSENRKDSSSESRSDDITLEDIEGLATVVLIPVWVAGCIGLKTAECFNKLGETVIDKVECGLNLSSNNIFLKAIRGVNNLSGSIIGKLEDVLDVPEV